MRKWEKPRLIVLVRSNLEELCIIYCKAGGNAIGTPTADDAGCYMTNCNICSLINAS